MAGDVWIIGASKGLGYDMAGLFAARGRAVVGMARRPPQDASAFAAFEAADVRNIDAFEALMARLFRDRATPELIVYSAVAIYQGPVAAQLEAHLRAEMDTNYLAFVRLCQAVAAFKPPGARVRVVATGSTLGYIGCPSLDNYSASKAALISFARSARRELAVHGISLQILSPPHMTNDGADLRGPQPFSVAWSAERFVQACEGGVPERLLGASNRFIVGLGRVAPELAQRIMDSVGVDALKRGASRTPA